MSRSKWSVLSGLLATLSLLACQAALAGDELILTSPSLDAGNNLPVRGAAFVTEATALAQQQPQQPCVDDCCCPHRNWIVDIEAVWMAPIQSQTFGGVGMEDGNGRLTESASARTNEDFVLSPRITLGYQGECWGVQARYWRLQTGSLGVDSMIGDGIQAGSFFRAETIDLEVTRLLPSLFDEGTRWRATFGARYAQLQEAAAVTFSEINGSDYYRSNMYANSQFGGAGITGSLTALRPIKDSGLCLFASVRGSILFDSNNDNYVATGADWINGSQKSHAAIDASTSSDSSLFIGEVQVGGQWNLPLQCVPATAFVRCAFEYQYWGTAHAGQIDEFSFAGPGSGPYSIASAEGKGVTHVNMLGFNVGAGLTW
jgi:hypothetical protein